MEAQKRIHHGKVVVRGNGDSFLIFENSKNLTYLFQTKKFFEKNQFALIRKTNLSKRIKFGPHNFKFASL